MKTQRVLKIIIASILVVTSVSANVLEDNTSRWWLFGWHEDGSVTNYGRATGTYRIN